MVDLILLAFIGFILVLEVKRPFLWVLLYIYIDILAPQRIGYGIITALPVSLIAFAAAFGGWLALDNKKRARFGLQQGLIALLMLYCWWTTGHADFPIEVGTKWDWVWKAMLFAIFLPLTLTTRLRIEAAVLTMLLAMSVIVIGAGMKVVFGGGGYGARLLIVDDNSGIYESSVLACMSIAIIPLIFWFTRHGQIFPPDWRVKLFGAGFILACTLIQVGTEARTGLVCFAVLLMLTFWHMKHKAVFAGLGAMAMLAMLAAVPFLPASFTDRMSTITNFQQDQSASTRVAVWSWTLDYVKEKPLGGGFDAYRGNSFEYRMRVEEEVGTTTVVRYADVIDELRAYHSAIFEVLGEQGYPGLIMWSLLQLSGLWSMTRIRRQWKDREGPGNQWQAPMALALGQAQIIYLVGALFTGIAYTPPMLILIAFQIGLANYLKPFGAPDVRAPQKLGTGPTSPPLATGKPA